MNEIIAIVFVAAGLLLLWKSADVMVGGAASIAERFRISPLVIGLTVVAMGTSAPEVAASIAAAIRDAGNIAIGNIYGSNIANLALVGGLAALLMPMHVSSRAIRIEIPVMVAVTALLWPVVANQSVSRLEGIGLLTSFVILLVLAIFGAKRNIVEAVEVPNVPIRSTSRNLMMIVLGLAGLVVGADITVRGAIVIGLWAGISEAVIGLTIVAVGTSLPELVTSIVASLKGHHEISLGNIVGSNIFNTLLVTGIASAVRPFVIDERFAGSEFAILMAVSVIFMVMAFTGKRIRRFEGALLLCGYIAYIVYLFVASA